MISLLILIPFTVSVIKPVEIKKKSMKDHVKRKEKGLFIDGNPYISLRFAETFHKIAAKIEYMK